MGNSYSFFAEYYDSLTENVNYPARASYFNKLIRKFGGKANGILLDLACGTGSLSEQMALLGYDVIGADISEDMLNEALNKKFESGLNIQYIRQDMRYLDLFGSVDVTICALDALNHLHEISDIKKVFERVSMFSEPGSLFIFDVNTAYKHKEILGENVFVYETDDVFCVWENHYIEKNDEVRIKLDFFERDGEKYNRYTECFSEYAYDMDRITALLSETGFKLEACYDCDSFNPVHDKTERMIFIAKK